MDIIIEYIEEFGATYYELSQDEDFVGAFDTFLEAYRKAAVIRPLASSVTGINLSANEAWLLSLLERDRPKRPDAATKAANHAEDDYYRQHPSHAYPAQDAWYEARRAAGRVGY